MAARCAPWLHRWPVKWRNNGRTQEQQACKRCGKIRQRDKKPCKWGKHRMRLDRRTNPKKLKCVRCPYEKLA